MKNSRIFFIFLKKNTSQWALNLLDCVALWKGIVELL